jgi:hypothetical protein
VTYTFSFTTPDGRKLVQSFAGCKDEEDGREKCRSIFAGCKFTKAEIKVEKKK